MSIFDVNVSVFLSSQPLYVLLSHHLQTIGLPYVGTLKVLFNCLNNCLEKHILNFVWQLKNFFFWTKEFFLKLRINFYFREPLTIIHKKLFKTVQNNFFIYTRNYNKFFNFEFSENKSKHIYCINKNILKN